MPAVKVLLLCVATLFFFWWIIDSIPPRARAAVISIALFRPSIVMAARTSSNLPSKVPADLIVRCAEANHWKWQECPSPNNARRSLCPEYKKLLRLADSTARSLSRGLQRRDSYRIRRRLVLFAEQIAFGNIYGEHRIQIATDIVVDILNFLGYSAGSSLFISFEDEFDNALRNLDLRYAIRLIRDWFGL